MTAAISGRILDYVEISCSELDTSGRSSRRRTHAIPLATPTLRPDVPAEAGLDPGARGRECTVCRDGTAFLVPKVIEDEETLSWTASRVSAPRLESGRGPPPWSSSRPRSAPRRGSTER